MAVLGLWATYAAAAAAALGLARRYADRFSASAGLLLAILPLVFTGRAVLTGQLYGPADLYFSGDPWKRLAEARTVGAPQNPILSDLAFANLPWRAAVREAAANGRVPLWNRFVLGGTPLLGAAQAGVFHPSTALGLWLPLALSWTFSCTFTLFLALLAAFVFFRDHDLGEPAALVGAAAWGFSTYLLFWNGWSVGPSTATFPLLALGLRRLARAPGRGGLALTAAALCLSLFGGHPESSFHAAAAGAAYFLWELAGRPRTAARAIAGAAGAGLLAFFLCGPQLFPLLEVLPHTAEYRARQRSLETGAARQAVTLRESAARLVPDVLPFAHGIYGRSRVEDRADGSGMPLGYAGAVLFPLAALSFGASRPRRGRVAFLAFYLAGLAYGASAPGLMDLTSRLPGFALALNYRLVFLAGFGLAGLAALGTEALSETGAGRRLAIASAAAAMILAGLVAAARPVLASRGLESAFVRREALAEIVPLALLALAAAGSRRRPAALANAALACLVVQRFFEMRGVYPTLPPTSLAPSLPTLAALPLGSEPARIVATADAFRPNAAALYRIEDVRGYESVILDRFSDTFPLWSKTQPASFNRVDDLSAPLLRFLNARYALGSPDEPVPAGWLEQARGPELAIFANPRALPRAFVPRTLRTARDPISAMASVSDFGETAILDGDEEGSRRNGEAALRVRETGPDLVVSVAAASRALVVTSIPDWPGWVAAAGGEPIATITVNHAFVGFWIAPGTRTVRLEYRPRSWPIGEAAFLAGLALAAVLAIRSRHAGP